MRGIKEYDMEGLLKELRMHLETLKTRESFEKFLTDALNINLDEVREAKRKQAEIASNPPDDFGESYANEVMRRRQAEDEAESTITRLEPALRRFHNASYDTDEMVSIARDLLAHRDVSVHDNALRNVMHLRILAISPVVNLTVAEERDDCIRRLIEAHEGHVLKKPKPGIQDNPAKKRPLERK